jgi:hypothetical protein
MGAADVLLLRLTRMMGLGKFFEVLSDSESGTRGGTQFRFNASETRKLAGRLPKMGRKAHRRNHRRTEYREDP